MVVLDKYNDSEEIDIDSSLAGADHDAPPSYETIAADRTGQSSNASTSAQVVVDEKSSRRSTSFTPSSSSTFQDVPVSPTRPRPPQPSPSIGSASKWLSMLSLPSPLSSNPSKQVRQTVLSLLRNLVLNPDSPNLISSCKDACHTYHIDFASLLHQPYIEGRSPIYWAIVNKRYGVIEDMVVCAMPLSEEMMSEVRLACLVTSNQELFQAMRSQREPFARQKAPLSTSSGTDALVLGSTIADEVSIREVEGQGAFVADMKINLWQKRMRISGRVTVEFIARGRIWALIFFSAPPYTATAGTWQVALCLLEHSPPTFVDSRLVVDLPSQPSSSQSQPIDLLSFSPPPENSSNSTARSPASPSPSTSPPPSTSNKSKFNSTVPKPSKRIEIRIKSKHGDRLAYNPSYEFPHRLEVAFSNQHATWPPRVKSWDVDGEYYTTAIVVPFEEDAGAELMYDNTPFLGEDGTLQVRLEARLAKPRLEADCVVC